MGKTRGFSSDCIQGRAQHSLVSSLFPLWAPLKVITWFLAMELSYWILMLQGREKITTAPESLHLLQVARAPSIKFLLTGTNVQKVCVSSRPDTVSSSKTLGPPPWTPYTKTENWWGCWKSEKQWQETALLHSRVHTDQCVWRHWGIRGGGSKKILVEPKPEDYIHRRRLWSVNSAEFSSSPLWPSFDHWPLQQNTNHKFMHYYLSAARGIRILSAWTASWLFTHMTPGSTGLAAVWGESVTYWVCSHKSSFFVFSEISPPCR